jgi:hypothetical protein
MVKQEISTWLNNASEKSESEIMSFLLLKIEEAGLKESWQKHYFLEELKKMSGVYSNNILEVFKKIEKNIKNEEGVPYHKRHIAFIIDYLVYSLLFVIIVTVIDSISTVSNGFVLVMMVLIYFLYFILSIFKFNTTVGSYVFKIKIVFNNKNNLFWKILLRELLFLTVFTGIGFIFHLIFGFYWDRAVGAGVKWMDKKEE